MITDIIPANTTFVSATTSRGTCSGTSTIICSIGNIANGEPAIQVTIKVIPTLQGTINNTVTSAVTQTDRESANNNSTVTTTVSRGTDVQLTKTDSLDPVVVGQTFTYTLTATNKGPYTLDIGDTLTIIDDIPVGLVINTQPNSNGWTCLPSTGYPLSGGAGVQISCTRTLAAAVAINGVAPILTMSAKTSSTGTITNQASLSSSIADGNPANNQGISENTLSNNGADVAVTKSQNGNPANVFGLNQPYVYTLMPVLNVGTTGATITVTDVFPSNTGGASTASARINSLPTGLGWSCSLTQGGSAVSAPVVGTPANPVTITCIKSGPISSTTLLSLDNITVNFTPTTTGDLRNTVTINAGVTDSILSDNTQTISATVKNEADLQVVKSSSTSNIQTNTPFSYTLATNNIGPLVVPSGDVVTVRDYPQTGIRINSVTSALGWTCTPYLAGGTPTAFPLLGNGTNSGGNITGTTANYVECTRSDGLAIANYPNIVLNAEGSVTGSKNNTARIAATATPDTGGVVTINTATGNNQESESVTFTVGASLNFTLVKADTGAGGTYGPDPVLLGNNVKYRLRMTNTNTSLGANVGDVITVIETIPPQATFISMAPPATDTTNIWSCGALTGADALSGRGGTVTCTFTVSATNTWAFNTSKDLDVILRADIDTTMTNVACVQYAGDTGTCNAAGSASNNDDPETTSIRGLVDLSITKNKSSPATSTTPDTTPVLAQDLVRYRVRVTNNVIPSGVSTGTNAVRFRDNLNAGPRGTFESYTAVTGTWVCDNVGVVNPNPVTCTLEDDLAQGDFREVDLFVRPNNVGNNRTNRATVSTQASATVVDLSAGNNNGTVTYKVTSALDLQVTKSDSPDPVKAGTPLQYVITLRNAGPANATTPVKITDNLPTNFTVTSVDVSGGATCTPSLPFANGTTLQCTWPTPLTANTQQTVTIRGIPTNTAATVGSLTNTVSVSRASVPALEIDSNPANDTANQPTIVQPAAIDLLISKVDTPDPVALNSNMTYTVTVTNQGPSIATNVLLTENLPNTYLGFISATPSQGTCSAPNVSHVMTCDLQNLGIGASATVVIAMSADTIGVDTNTVSVSADENDTDIGNNIATQNTTIQLGADLQFTKLATPDPVIAGNTVFYYLKVKNAGPSNANVTITDTLPSGVAYQSAVTSQGTCSHSAGVVTCNLGTVPYLQTAQVTLIATATVGGIQSNSATVTSSTPDPNPSDNTDTADVTVLDGIVRGRVFADNGVGSGAPNDGLQNGGEVGIANVLVRLTDCASTQYAVTQTDGLGNYQLIVPAVLTTGVTLCVVEQNLSGYMNTGGSAGTTGGAYNLSTDRTQFTYTDGVTYTGVNFADVAQSALYTDGAQQTQPGTTVTYAHQFFAGTEGSVSFALSSTASPNTLLWSEVLYQDSDCNGLLDVAEPVVSGSYTVSAGDTICLIVKQFVPANATQGAFNVVTISSSFVYDVLTPTVTEVLTRTDTTTVSVGGTGTLSLHKVVDKTVALPGEMITYTITYSNNGTEAISNIVVNDAVPAFTHNPVASCVLPLPANLTLCTPTIISPAIQWIMTGTLAFSQQGQVRFNVTLDN
ncbi:MAG: DUF11 domain-containing protein [Moraxellaceae bacterium]|nr:DUF11 domain-containing protein [Moraxellaceae bacterium]